jgi:hypothetical protein
MNGGEDFPLECGGREHIGDSLGKLPLQEECATESELDTPALYDTEFLGLTEFVFR